MEQKTRQIIFIVDDNVTNLAIGKNALIETYDVFTLNSGERLLKILEKKTPDMILLDVEMPEMNGYEVIKRLKKDPKTKSIPVAFLTAKGEGENEMEGLSLGAIDYIIKPFSPPLLRKRIEVHLLVESQKRELQHYNDNLQKMVEAKTETVLELQDAILKTIAELVECRDDITGGHIERTQNYLKSLLSAMLTMGVYKEEILSWDLKLVLQSAQLHDVGKIMIKDSILLKPGKLTEEEFNEMKKHTTLGVQIIEKIEKSTKEHTFLEYAKILSGSHHEKWNGSGYPLGLKEKDIPLLGRVMAIADVYDALVFDRPYKKAFSHEKAVSIIEEGKGTHFEPALTEVFLQIANEFNDIATFYKIKSEEEAT